jgi:hypothetical protein
MRAMFFQGMLYVFGRRFPDRIHGTSVAEIPKAVNNSTIGQKRSIVNLNNRGRASRSGSPAASGRRA